MILLLTYSGDTLSTQRVMEELTTLGREFLRIDTNRYPVECPVCSIITPDHTEFQLHTEDGTTSFSPADVKSVWTRCFSPAYYPQECPQELISDSYPTAASLVEQAVGFCQNAFWMNHPADCKRADQKLLQLQSARHLGFQIPETIATNETSLVIQFFDSLDGQVVTKSLLPRTVDLRDVGSDFTCLITEEHLEGLVQVRGKPQIFQRYLPIAREFRVVVVGESCFVGGIEREEPTGLTVDWRNERHLWQEERLSDELLDMCQDLAEEMSLPFATIDLAETTDGELYFLEIDHGGEWEFLERDAQLPISQAIAEELAK